MPVLCNCKLIQLQIGEIFPHLKTIIFLKLLYIHNIEYKKNHRLIFIAKQYSVDVSNLLTPKYLIFMKIIHLLISIVIFFVATANAQPPEKMSYQAVVRNEKGALVTNRTIGLKASIQKFTFAIPKPFYTTIYAETHTLITNENGLISIAIGTGSVVAGSENFADINWSSETYYLRTDIDLSGGSEYSITSTSQLLSVPYAFTAKTANGLTPLKIGDSYQGGVIFWLDDTGRHGLIAATTDQSKEVKWGPFKTFGTTTGDGIYAGEMNTMLILAAQMVAGYTVEIAARLCANYEVTENKIVYGDWYLPSYFELSMLYDQKNVVGNFSAGAYVSSTEANDDQAKAIVFGTGAKGQTGKSVENAVRAIRKF